MVYMCLSLAQDTADYIRTEKGPRRGPRRGASRSTIGRDEYIRRCHFVSRVDWLLRRTEAGQVIVGDGHDSILCRLA